MISRLETMVLMGTDIPLMAVRQQIASSLDVVIHLGRLRDKSRRVLDVVEIEGFKDGEIVYNPLYHFTEEPMLRERGTYGNGVAGISGPTGHAPEEIESSRVLGRLKATGNSLKNIKKLLSAGISLE